MTGTLYVIGTPIGNLGDISIRALKTLRQVSYIAAEDTRHTRKLLSAYHIHTSLFSYNEHNHREKVIYIKELIQSGHDVALVTDAGMPGISDPGHELIKEIQEAELSITAVPGPSAFITALILSGLETDKFSFAGFFPRKNKEQQEFLEWLAKEQQTVIIYESPQRILTTLDSLQKNFPQREVALCRELTKKHEEIIRGDVTQVKNNLLARTAVKGEMVLVISGCKEVAAVDLNEEKLLAEMKTLIAYGMSPKKAVLYLQKREKISKNKLYALSLKL